MVTGDSSRYYELVKEQVKMVLFFTNSRFSHIFHISRAFINQPSVQCHITGTTLMNLEN